MILDPAQAERPWAGNHGNLNGNAVKRLPVAIGHFALPAEFNSRSQEAKRLFYQAFRSCVRSMRSGNPLSATATLRGTHEPHLHPLGISICPDFALAG